MISQANGEVAITRYDGTINALKEGIDLIKGLEDLKPSDNILIKPNVVWGAGGNEPKYGMITTSRIIEDIIILLREKGCNKISIGEGSLANDEIGANTFKAFAWSGIEKVAKKYDVKLIDFNTSHKKVKLGKNNFEIARSVFETDFLIDVPVLKTHATTKVSLGMKNLKGCLSMKSKKKFHMLDLNEMIALLSTHVKPNLTVIDGIYALERGPMSSGRAYRTNLIITGKDVFSCDIVGSAVLGIDPKTVNHFIKFSEINDRPIETESVHVMGEKIKDVLKPLRWQVDFEVAFRLAGIDGVTVQWPGDRFCTNCVVCSGDLFKYYCKDNAGIKVEPAELCFGGGVKAKEGSEKVILIGDCAIRSNRANKNAIKVEGCPPSITECLKIVTNNTLEKKRARRILAIRTFKNQLSKLGIYNERFRRGFTYDMPEFDPKHFKI